MPTLLFKDKEFFSTLVRLATPIALQNLIIFSLGMVDVMMIGQLGEAPVAAIGLAEQPFFLFVCCCLVFPAELPFSLPNFGPQGHPPYSERAGIACCSAWLLPWASPWW